MAEKPTVLPVGSLQNESSAIDTLNANFDTLANAVKGSVSSSVASNNTMNVPLDMNGQRIINLPSPVNPNDPIRLRDALLFQGPPGPPGQGIDTSGNVNINGSYYGNDLILPDGTKISTLLSVTPEQFGAIGDNVTDDTVPVRAAYIYAVAKGKPLEFLSMYRITDTLTVTSPNSFIYGGGNGTGLNIDRIGKDAKPAIDVRNTAIRSVVTNFKITGNGALTDSPYGYHPAGLRIQIIAGSGIMVQADKCVIDTLWIDDCWDNGLSVLEFDWNPLSPQYGNQVNGNPKAVIVQHIYGQNNGCGCSFDTAESLAKITARLEKNGALVDIGTGKACVVDDVVDHFSYGGAFILDIGGGADCVASNIISWYPTKDTRYPDLATGLGVYIGSADSTFVNVKVIGASDVGIWVDYFTEGNSYTNMSVNGSAKHGILIKAQKSTFTNCYVKNAGLSAANTFSAFFIDPSAAPLPDLHMIGCGTVGTTQKYGIGIGDGVSGSNDIVLSVIGGVFSGATAKISPNFVFYSVAFLGMGPGGRIGLGTMEPQADTHSVGQTLVSDNTLNPSSTENYYGLLNSGGRRDGSMIVESLQGDTFAIGHDPIHQWHVLQGGKQGIGSQNMCLQPAGGLIYLRLPDSGGSFAVYKAEVGAADSAGAGYRQIRVSNT